MASRHSYHSFSLLLTTGLLFTISCSLNLSISWQCGIIFMQTSRPPTFPYSFIVHLYYIFQYFTIFVWGQLLCNHLFKVSPPITSTLTLRLTSICIQTKPWDYHGKWVTWIFLIHCFVALCYCWCLWLALMTRV